MITVLSTAEMSNVSTTPLAHWISSLSSLVAPPTESSREAGVLIERVAYAALAQTPEAQGAVEAFVSGQAPEA